MRRRPKTKEPRIEQAGEWLHKAHEARKRFAPLPEALMPRSAEEAYAIQAEYVGMRARRLGRVAGYKIALTTPAMRKMMGMSEEQKDPDPIEDVRRGLGLLFRAAKSAVSRIPTEKLEEAVVTSAKEVGRALENVGRTIEREVLRKGEPTGPRVADEPAKPEGGPGDLKT